MAPLNRRRFIQTTGSAAMLSSVIGCSSLIKKRRPNVLFIAMDDLRPQLGCYGHKKMISPNMDALAAEGVLFERTYCQVPVCGASRASLFTGMYPTRDRFVTYYTRADKDAPGITGLPKYFKENGYYTLANSKIYHHHDDAEGAWSEPHWDPPSVKSWRDYLSQENLDLEQNLNSAGPPYEMMDVPDNAYKDGKNADKTIKDLKRLKTMGQPFFLATGFLKPHLPFNAPQKYWDMYPESAIDLADNPFRPRGAPDAAMHNWGELRAYHGIPGKGPLSDAMARTLVRGYYACTSYSDAQVGKVLSALKSLGLWENTIVILWGDHGWNLGEHGLWCKHCNFETALHSPMIVSAPGHRQGTRTSALTEFVDIYPSLCELAGLPLSDHLQGKSFVPLLQKPSTPWKEAAYSRYRDGDSIKTDRYRYTEYTDENGEFARMLYDHDTDPMENINITEAPENAALIASLNEQMAALKAGM